MRGSLIYVMGPSGAGKDALIEIAKVKLADRSEVTFPRRYVTRSAGLGSENDIFLSRSAFDYLEAGGHFLFSWRSHRLAYGLDRQIEQDLADGRLTVVNGSRAYLPRALELCPTLKPILITARTETLAARLQSRGRETAEERAERLRQPTYDFKAIKNLRRLDNSGELKAAAYRFCAYLYEELAVLAAGSPA
ncbi:MAG: phosphonate metabolism protein/1,5-bisphosphokinase (PRPP-forming) PhnN [Deltaproteobacteria bacterium]|nr:phosphonate metabolism protein/1,5-bisphosphokinase (PRPP-forming) PhnN [Deltaproteobacteria bacterium]